NGETDLNNGEFALTPAGPWYNIFTGPQPEYLAPWNISSVWSSLPDGYNTICVRCYDSASPKNWVMNNITIKKDVTPPSVTIHIPAYGWYTTDPGAIIDVDFSNDSMGSSLERAEYSINSATGPWYGIFSLTAPIGDFIDNWQVKWSKLDDGVNTIYIRLFDDAGNEDITVDIVTFRRDTLPPIVVVRQDSYGWYSSDPGPVIDVDFSNGGNGSNLDYAQYSIGTSGSWPDVFSIDMMEFTAKWPVSWFELQEGANKIHVRCFDLVGFKAVVNNCFTVYKDTTAPQIKVNKNIYGWYTSDPGQVIDVDFNNVDSSTSLLDYAQYRVHPEPGMGTSGPWRNIFSSDVTDFSDNWQVRWDDLKEGNNTIEVQVFDLATNKNSTIDTIYFLKDINPPKISAKIEEYGWFSLDPGSIIDVDFDNTGTGSKLDFAEYSVDGGAWQKICQITAPNYIPEWYVDWSALAEGENIVQVRVWDEAGLSSNQNIKIYKDTVLPEIKINKAEYGWYNTDPDRVIEVAFYCDSDYVENSKSCSLLEFSEYKIGVDGEWITIVDQVSINYSDPWSVKWTDLMEG
ncbi:MAG: hypothetical protein KAJ51_14525, partial [Thermoplasmata archaeon]|nr:hypothetical protein [Thermoplasmata archaeon]